MDWRKEWKKLALLVLVFLACFFMPIGQKRFDRALWASIELVQWYAREHVLLCLVPAFFIAGAIGVFLSQASVMKYLGAASHKVLAYAVASVSGSVLAVCSCTILPLFAGIYKMGAGLGPAVAFLYAGPAINVLAIILTARILGLELGIARAVGAVVFSIVIGVIMHFLYRREEREKAQTASSMPVPEVSRPLYQNVLFFAVMLGILVFANWAPPEGHAGGRDASTSGIWSAIWNWKWCVTSALAGIFCGVLVLWYAIPWWKMAVTAGAVLGLALLLPMDGMWIMAPFAAGAIGLGWAAGTTSGDSREWLDASWEFARQILPLLLLGVLVAGFLLGRPGQEGMIPSAWVERSVGGNSIWANCFASVAGAFMYFATLTEVPILKGLIEAGMGKGPALALLLAGPALSLPNMLVIRSVMGTRKTLVFVGLVIVMATLSGMLFGALF